MIESVSFVTVSARCPAECVAGVLQAHAVAVSAITTIGPSMTNGGRSRRGSRGRACRARAAQARNRWPRHACNIAPAATPDMPMNSVMTRTYVVE